MKTNKELSAELTKLHAKLQKEIADYVKAKRGELRKRPVYLKKDSDVAIDSMREAFEWFILSGRK